TIYSEQGVIHNGRMIVSGEGIIEAIGDEHLPLPADAVVSDADGSLIIPGLIDIHVHGALGKGMMGSTFDDLDSMSQYHAAHGTTAFLGTTSTGSKERLILVLRNAAEAIGRTSGAELAGIHLEGPYLDE